MKGILMEFWCITCGRYRFKILEFRDLCERTYVLGTFDCRFNSSDP